MEGIKYKDIISSKPFRFFVGPDKHEFTIHSALVASQSQPLNALVHGKLREARECLTVWEDIDESTFILFSQYAYTGDYDAAEPEREPQPEAEPESEPTAEPWPDASFPVPELEPDAPPLVPEVEPRTTQKMRLWNDFTAASHYSNDVNFKPRPHEHEFEDYTDVLLSHARLYVFADRYWISELKALSLSRLRKTLAVFKLYDRRTRDILDLLRFCYEEEPVPDALKELVVLYAACKVEDLWSNVEFRQFVGAHGEFGASLITWLLHKLDD